MIYKLSPPRLITELIIAFTIATTCWGCHKYNELDPKHKKPAGTNVSLMELRSAITDTELHIDHELTAGGYITSCDRANNFYRTFTFQDQTAGAEVMAGIYDLHNIYPLGYYITVNLRGCTLALHNGVLQIGRRAKAYSNYPTDYFSSRVLLDQHVTTYDIGQTVSPAQYTIPSLELEMCGTLIRIDDLSLCSNLFHDVWQVNTDGRWSGYNIFCDSEGNRLAVHTSEYATYAQHHIPDHRLSITGILQHGALNGTEYFFIKMRNEKDCSLSD